MYWNPADCKVALKPVGPQLAAGTLFAVPPEARPSQGSTRTLCQCYHWRPWHRLGATCQLSPVSSSWPIGSQSAGILPYITIRILRSLLSVLTTWKDLLRELPAWLFPLHLATITVFWPELSSRLVTLDCLFDLSTTVTCSTPPASACPVELWHCFKILLKLFERRPNLQMEENNDLKAFVGFWWNILML